MINKQKPWLLEVNTPPALGVDCDTDELVKPQLIKDIVDILDFEKYSDYCNKIEYESVMKKQKQQYFFKKRFKSQRNTSVTSGTNINNINLNIASTMGKSQLSHISTGGVNNSLLLHNERINIKSSSGCIPSTNYSLTSKSPTVFDENQIPVSGNTKGIKNINIRDTKKFYSSLSQKPKSCVRKGQQGSSKNVSNSNLRPAPYFKYSLRHSNTTEVSVSFEI